MCEGRECVRGGVCVCVKGESSLHPICPLINTLQPQSFYIFLYIELLNCGSRAKLFNQVAKPLVC